MKKIKITYIETFAEIYRITPSQRTNKIKKLEWVPF